MYVSVMYESHVYVGQQKAFGSSRSKIRHPYEPPNGCWEQNSGPLKQQ